MHPLLFAMKRSYQRGLAHAYPLVEDLGLTPARFDLMFHLFTNGPTLDRAFADMWTHQPQTQKSITRALGVSRQTVRRMLLGLEEKGLVVRGPPCRWEPDKRTKSVMLTDVGRALVRRATKIAYPRGLLADPFQVRRDPLQTVFKRGSSANDVDELWSRLQALASRLGDTATLAYPTLDPDD
jgi:DNA-binding MarR family transcriptional regulator